ERVRQPVLRAGAGPQLPPGRAGDVGEVLKPTAHGVAVPGEAAREPGPDRGLARFVFLRGGRIGRPRRSGACRSGAAPFVAGMEACGFGPRGRVRSRAPGGRPRGRVARRRGSRTTRGEVTWRRR